VTFAYTDYYKVSGSAIDLVNKLVVEVTDMTTKIVYRPLNVSGVVGYSNLQMIEISNPTANTNYELRVYCVGSLATTSQPFAVVVSSVGATTYLQSSYDVSNYRKSDSKYKLSSGATTYIIVLTILLFFLLTAYYLVHRRVNKASTLTLDPRNFHLINNNHNDSTNYLDFDGGDYNANNFASARGGQVSILDKIARIRERLLNEQELKNQQ
jgi:hypothetical protein